ncbi:MAG: tRNA A-37 threonylcarbamoyl transferase component Bud32 [Verrucomicrobiales bacterium]|jgi:tRNA A-37 threonylcarbamoyl transferase component Bud32
MTDTTESNCPTCGDPIPEEAPQGLCPKCVLANAAPALYSSAPQARTPAPTVEEIAEHFSELDILEVIGVGGMGVVYKVRQPKLEREVALKILSHDLATDPAFVERFNREARVLARLNHPNIVTVFDFGTAGPYCYLLMELVDGVNLRQAMHTGGFTPAESLALVQDICSALSFAHEEGILHRDIKPENILIDSRGRVKIADFGIAKLVGDDPRNDVTLTLQGAILGSPQYMAPEQIETPGDVDQRADIYSLGVVFYEMLTGELPIGRFAAPSERSSLDPRIDEIVMRTLEKERQLRYQSAGELRTKVESITQSPPAGAAGEGSAAAPSADAIAGTARFATASAILTGISLLLAVVAVFILIAADAGYSNPQHEKFRKTFVAMLAAISVAVVGVPALLGIILGSKALGEIRRSAGKIGGLGSAMFGTLTLPVVLVIAMGCMMLVFLLKTAGGGMAGLFLVIAAALAGPLSLILLVRSVGRWARGDADPDGGATGAQVAMRGAGVIFAVLLNLTILALWNASSELPDNDLDFGRRGNAPAETSSRSESRVKVVDKKPDGQRDKELWDSHWPVAPHQVLQLIVPKGHAATVELVRTDASGKETVDASWAAVAPDSKPFEGVIAIGAPEDLQAKQQEGVAALKGTFWSLKSEATSQLSKFYPGRLDLNRGTRTVDLSNSNRDKLNDHFELGKFRPRGSSQAENLSLRVVSKPRPGPGDPFVLGDELFGMGRPSEVIDEWIKLREDWRKRSSAAIKPPGKTAADWTEIEPEIELDFVAPAGQVTVFSLQAPWDRDHESPDDWYVVAPEKEDYKGTIKIGTVGSSMNDGRKTVEILATLHDSTGEAKKSHTFKVAGEQTLKIPSTYSCFEMDEVPGGQVTGHGDHEISGGLDLSQQGIHFIYFSGHAGSPLEDTLRFLAWSVPRPDPDRAADSQGGRIGPTNPPNVVDRWIQQRQKKLTAKKGEGVVGEKLGAIDRIEGAAFLRSGFTFDTTQRQLDGRTDVRIGEALLLRKGSKASLSLDPATSVQLDASSEGVMVIFVQPWMWFLPPLAGLKAEFGKLSPGNEFSIATAFGVSLEVGGETTFQLSSEGKLEIWEGELKVIPNSGEEPTRISAGQEMSFPRTAILDDFKPEAVSPVERPSREASGDEPKKQ